MRTVKHHFIQILNLIASDLSLLLHADHHLLLETIPEIRLPLVGDSQHGHTSLKSVQGENAVVSVMISSLKVLLLVACTNNTHPSSSTIALALRAIPAVIS